jgi:hypothetical protein
MIVFPIAPFVLFGVLQIQNRATFFVELAGIWVFALYWLVKDHEISTSHADWLAMCGELRVEEEPKRSPFRKVMIEKTDPAKEELHPGV